jgi:cytochrome c-type biogenesis protein
MTSSIFSTGNISFLLVFIEGLLSFFSPCVIPLIPIYVSYLAGNARIKNEEGVILYQRRKVFLHTLFFVLGISFAFFLLGMSFTALGSFFKSYQTLFTKLGGILILLLGLVQVGFLELPFLQKEHKLPFQLTERSMNPLLAFVMGFTFSFAWTPCVGPALSSVLILASSSRNALIGNLLVLIYSAGFVIPFLLLGLFTTQVLRILKKYQKLLKYTVKAAGILLIIIGIMTFTGWMNGVSAYLNRYVPQSKQESSSNEQLNSSSSPSDTPNEDNSSSENIQAPGASQTSDDNQNQEASQNQKDSQSSEASQNPENNQTSDESESSQKRLFPAFDFTLKDQYGKEHTLSDYKGKVVFLNFWATWCPPCQKEMPDIEALYQDHGRNEGDVIILGIANPSGSEYPNNSDVSENEIIEFLLDHSYSFPVLFDTTGDVLSDYSISAFPTTFLIDTAGNIYGYASGMLTREMMDNAIQQTIDSADD